MLSAVLNEIISIAIHAILGIALVCVAWRLTDMLEEDVHEQRERRQ